MSNQQDDSAKINSLKKEGFINFLDYNFMLNCTACGAKVLDPDKSKGQIYLKGKCPSCGQESKVKDGEKKSRRERKRERKEQKMKERACRGKY